MITISCDRCRKPIEVPDDRAGETIDCPFCGDANRVPRKDSASAPASAPASSADRASALGLPPDAGPEKEVLVVRPVMFRARPLVSLLVVLGFLAGCVGTIVFFVRGDSVWGIICLILAIASLGVIAWWKVATFDHTLRITNKRIILVSGLLRRDTSEVSHESVQNVQVHQSFTDRLLGIGKIGVSSAGQSDIEIEVEHVPNPLHVRDVIDAYRNNLR